MTDGVDDEVLEALRKAVEKEGALAGHRGPKIGGVKTAKGKKLPADQALSGAPSILFDAVAMLPSEAGAEALAKEAAAIDWLRDAFGHLKIIGYVPKPRPMFEKAAVARRRGRGCGGPCRRCRGLHQGCKEPRIWAREPTLRSPG